MERTQTLKSLSLAALAFVLAGAAQLVLHGVPKVFDGTPYGWLIYGVAAVLFVAAFGRMRIVEVAEGRLQEAPPTAVLFTWRQGTLLVLAIIFTVISQVLFGVTDAATGAWLSHIVSVLLLVAAFLPHEKPDLRSWIQAESWSVVVIRWLVVIGILGLATFMRVWELSEFPFGVWIDEAFNGLTAEQILQDPSFRPIYLDVTAMPAHFNYLITLAFSFLGTNIFAIRLVAALFGVAGVLFAYLLFRRWFGQWIGLVAAFILAVMRFHLTFSRFGMQGITTPAFEFAALYFLDRALSTKKMSDFAWFGLTVGLGLTIHVAFRLFPFIVVIFLLGLLIASMYKYGVRNAAVRFIKGMLPHAMVALIALLIAIAPVANFALQNRDVFFARTSHVSIFNKREDPNLTKALLNTTVKHLEMFNVRGDRNGRHNLPGEPMLDPLMGVLFILGAAYALWRWREPSNFLMLILFTVMLQAGILSLDFEAPQSYRAIGIIPALVYFITLPIALLSRSLTQQLRGEQSSDVFIDSRVILGTLAVLGTVAYLNYNTFFIRQRNDPSTWAQHSAAETLIANILSGSTGEYDFVLSAMYDGHPTVRFLAGDVKNYQRWTVTDRFPLVRDPGRGVIILFDEKLLPAYHDLQRIYPNVTFTEHRAPMGGGVVLYEAKLTPEDLRAAQGVVASYYAGEAVTGSPAKEEILSQVSLDWNNSQPLPAPFIVEVRSTLFATDYGQYTFSLRGIPNATLWIDENPVGEGPITLARATHALRIQVPGNTGKFELWWQTPTATEAQPVPASNLFNPSITNSGLLGEYFPTPDWTGEPAFTQIDPQLAFYFHIIPLPRPYSVKWTGGLYIPADGEYTFALESVDGSSLLVDDQIVVDNPEGRTTIENKAQFTQGWHDITVFFSDRTGATRIYLYWMKPGDQERELIPPKYFSPPMGQYPIPAEAEQ